MFIQQAYRFRLRPTPAQRLQMARFAGARRWVWNEALALQKTRLDADLGVMSYAALCRWLTLQRRMAATSWLAEVPVHTSQQALKDLRRAFDDFFDRSQPGKRFPQFKKKGERDAFRYPDPGQFEIDQANGRVKLPKLGWVRYRRSRVIEGVARQVTVRRDGEHWYVSILAKREVPDPVHPSTTEVGIDLGIARFATLSDGAVYAPLHARRTREHQVARLQRQLARKVKFSNNWKKQKRRVQALHRKIRAARSDFIHKASTEISENQAVVVMEDLRVANMSRSARGTPEKPGAQVRAKAGLNRAITDQGWAAFRRQLGYKLAWRGGILVLVEPAYTSQRCSACGHATADNRRIQAGFACVRCGHEDHADLNAAKNILAAGRAATACGGYPDVIGPMKQESTGAQHAPPRIPGLQPAGERQPKEIAALPAIARGLMLKDPWGFEILANGKDWEIRGKATAVRERIAILRSGTGTAIGTVEIVGCVGPLDPTTFVSAKHRHHVDVPDDLEEADMPYPTTYAWTLSDPVLFEEPVPYKHPSGAVIFVRLSDEEREAIAEAEAAGRRRNRGQENVKRGARM